MIKVVLIALLAFCGFILLPIDAVFVSSHLEERGWTTTRARFTAALIALASFVCFLLFLFRL